MPPSSSIALVVVESLSKNWSLNLPPFLKQRAFYVKVGSFEILAALLDVCKIAVKPDNIKNPFALNYPLHRTIPGVFTMRISSKTYTYQQKHQRLPMCRTTNTAEVPPTRVGFSHGGGEIPQHTFMRFSPAALSLPLPVVTAPPCCVGGIH